MSHQYPLPVLIPVAEAIRRGSKLIICDITIGVVAVLPA